ncbi:MAG TPA: hypothetical protein VGC13_21805 [Longimicrobium sp.]|jgi:hypothetical protein|uniref:hypothetical protein n=1 Tax=Longimicrobium sp. TaxID=2029185 RepID=UPI002EDB6183
MFRTRNISSAVLATLAIAGLGACADDAQAPFEAQTAAVTQTSATPAGQRVAQLVALALREPSARGVFHRAVAASPVRESKLFLSGYLGGEGTPLLQAMARAGGLKVSEVQALVQQLGPVEIYLPVAEHRAAWAGGSDLLVAFAERDRAQPYGFDLNGRPVQLDIDEAPATPTVVITYAEGFDEKGNPHGANRPQGASNALAPRLAVLTVPYTGVWADSIETKSDFENWASGSPEFELYIQNAQTRANVACSGESSVEPYNFNMDGTFYRHPVLLAADYEIPESVPMVIAMFEDDDVRCKIVQGKDYIKLAVEGFAAAGAAYKGVTSKEMVNGQWIMQLHTALVNFIEIAQGNDEFVGVSTTTTNIDGIARRYTLRNDYMNATGTIRLQWRTDTGY